MKQQPKNLFALARAKARRFHFGLAILQWTLFQVAAGLFGIVWGIAYAVGFVAWSYASVEIILVTALLTSTAAGTTWWMAYLGWMLEAKLSKAQQRMRAWFTSILLVSVGATLIVGLGQSALVKAMLIALIGVAAAAIMTPFLSRISKRIDCRKVTSLDIPARFFPLLQDIPVVLPDQVHYLVSNAFDDWKHLRELRRLSDDSPLSAYVDLGAMQRDSDRALEYLLRRTRVVTILVELASRGEPSQQRAAQVALERMTNVANVLHEAVAAASQYAASEQTHEGLELKQRVQQLTELVSYLDVNGLAAEMAPLQLDDERFRVMQEAEASSSNEHPAEQQPADHAPHDSTSLKVAHE